METGWLLAVYKFYSFFFFNERHSELLELEEGFCCGCDAVVRCVSGAVCLFCCVGLLLSGSDTLLLMILQVLLMAIVLCDTGALGLC